MTCNMSCLELWLDADIIGFMNAQSYKSMQRNNVDINGDDVYDEEDEIVEE